MKNFENELLLMVKNIEFKNVKNKSHEKLKEDINEIKTSDKMFVGADKSRHISKMEKQQYPKLLTENITETYKKSNKKKISNINFTAKKITEKLSIERMEESEAYITIKEPKDEFHNKIPCQLINPSKCNLGKFSKVILNKINQHIVASTNINQWKNTQNVLNWFDKIENKRDIAAFIPFDIENFYPSITMKLLYKIYSVCKRNKSNTK